MAGRGEETRQQILGAAIAEFSQHGIAGARVDRIAKTAGANISSLFRYFGNKSLLFDAAFDALAVRSIDVVPFDALLLPEYAGKLMDHYQANADLVRLSAWYQLERPSEGVPDPVVASEGNKLEAIRQAQAAGAVSTQFAPHELLSMILHLSLIATGATPIISATATDFDAARRSVVEAVRALTRVEC